MSGFWIGVLIALIPGSISFLYKLLSNLFRLPNIEHKRADLDVSVIKHNKKNQKVKIKIIYAGSSPLIVKGIELTSSLQLAFGREGLLACFQVARGYLTDDWQGLQAVFGQKFIREKPACIRKSFNLILGIAFSVLILSWIYNPFGLIMLLMGPYDSVKIKSSNISIRDLKSGKNQLLPFSLSPAKERELLIDYTLAAKSKRFIPTEVKYIQKQYIPKKSPWILPRLGHHVLHGNLKLSIKAPAFLIPYRKNLDKNKEDFILIPQRGK
jgi:hypothetical protein